MTKGLRAFFIGSQGMECGGRRAREGKVWEGVVRLRCRGVRRVPCRRLFVLAEIQRAYLVHIEAFDWRCPQQTTGPLF